MKDKHLSELCENLDKHSDLAFVVENISDLGWKQRQQIEEFIRYRIFEYHMLLGKIKD